jgi:hypothetical protein
MSVLCFSAPIQENYVAPQIRIHQIYPGTPLSSGHPEVKPSLSTLSVWIGSQLLEIYLDFFGQDFGIAGS